jgi:hypothetical protein
MVCHFNLWKLQIENTYHLEHLQSILKNLIFEHDFKKGFFIKRFVIQTLLKTRLFILEISLFFSIDFENDLNFPIW